MCNICKQRTSSRRPLTKFNTKNMVIFLFSEQTVKVAGKKSPVIVNILLDWGEKAWDRNPSSRVI